MAPEPEGFIKVQKKTKAEQFCNRLENEVMNNSMFPEDFKELMIEITDELNRRFKR